MTPVSPSGRGRGHGTGSGQAAAGAHEPPGPRLPPPPATTTRRAPGSPHPSGWWERAHVWALYLAGGLAAVAAYFLLPPSGAALLCRLAVYLFVSGSAATALFVGVRRCAGAHRIPWLLLGVSQLVCLAADAAFYGSHYLREAPGFPGLGDLLHLGHYPLLVAGLLLLALRLRPGRRAAGLYDGLMISIAAGVLAWFHLVAPRLQQEQSLLTALALVAYPVVDLTLLAVSLRLILGGPRQASLCLLTVYLAAVLVADFLYVLQRMNQTYRVGNYLDAIWLTADLALGAAALHPAMSRPAGRPAPAGPARSGRRQLLLAAAALVVPGVLAARGLREGSHDLVALAAAGAAICLLVILRMGGLLADQERLAITDSLTGLHTRRHLERVMSAVVGRITRDGARDGASVGLLLIDVDHFKSINDRYGHPAGDQVLVEVANRLRTAVRPGDLLARYGGEEFAVLVTDPRHRDLAALGERLRHQVARLPVVVLAHPAQPGRSAALEDTADGAAGRRERADGGNAPEGALEDALEDALDALEDEALEDVVAIQVTVSVGAAAIPGHAKEGRELVATADRALYAAKAAGRNRVVVGELPPSAAAALKVSAPDAPSTVEQGSSGLAALGGSSLGAGLPRPAAAERFDPPAGETGWPMSAWPSELRAMSPLPGPASYSAPGHPAPGFPAAGHPTGHPAGHPTGYSVAE